MVHTRIFPVNLLAENTVVVFPEGAQECVVVDPGMMGPGEQAAVLDFLSSEGLTPAAILLTHGHFDHLLGVPALLSKYDIPVYMHPADLPVARLGAALNPAFAGISAPSFGSPGEHERWLSGIRPVSEAEPVVAAGMTFRVIETPGHSPGGVCYYLEEGGLLFSGDTLFAGSIGRTDLSGGDYDALIRSVMDKVMGLGGDVEVIPGHGGRTTLGREAMTNPFLIPFNEPESPWDDLDPLSLEGM